MKKILLLGFMLTMYCFINAQVSIKVIDAGSDLGLENIELVRKDKRGKIVETKFTNSQGIATFKDNSGLIVMTEKMKKYRHFPIELWRSDKNNTLTYYVYPSEFLESSFRYSSKKKKSNTDQPEPDSEEIKMLEVDEDDSVTSDSLANDLPAIVDVPDEEAQFPGGAKAMKEYLAKEILYPRHAIKMGEQGKVFIEYVVEKDGSITQVKILRGISESIDLEAIRVVRKMPKWIPASAKGELVRARCRIPISFILQ